MSGEWGVKGLPYSPLPTPYLPLDNVRLANGRDDSGAAGLG